MFRNYLVTAVHNITRHKLYSFINIAGLTVGLTCTIFIILFVRDELSYDHWIPGVSNLYRVESTFANPGQQPLRITPVPFPVPYAMQQKIPEVRAMTRLNQEQSTIIIGERQFAENVDVVDPNFFQIIKLPLMAGDPQSVFSQPETVVLSQSAAKKYFGDAQPVGRTLTISAKLCDANRANCRVEMHPMTVTGLMRDLPRNTQLAGDVFVPNTSSADQLTQPAKESWANVYGWGFIVLAPGADPNAVLSKTKALIDSSLDEKKVSNISLPGSDVLQLHLTPFVDDHLSTDHYGSMTTPGSWTTVYGFMAIGVLILLVACFNFTNLATARATLRAREISLRKVMGASRGQLVIQFLGEALLMAMLSLVFAMATVEMLLPAFNSFLNKNIRIQYIADWPLTLAIIGVAIIAGLLSGVYPAFVLSKFRPAAILRMDISRQSGSSWLRTSLVVLQFAVSIGLGISASVVFAQINFARNIDLGFSRNNIVVIDGSNLSPVARQSFADVLNAYPGIESAAISNLVPFDGQALNVDVHISGGVPNDFVRWQFISPEFTKLYNITALTGRLLSKSHGGDQFLKPGVPYNILINAAAAKHFGYTATGAVGKVITVHTTKATVVGVVPDLRVEGAQQPIKPAIYRYLPDFSPNITVRIRGNRISETLSYIDRQWHIFAPTTAMSRRFLADDYNRQFQSDEKQGTIFSLFVGIAIFIACLGLFGLAAFTAERRTKEIGVRKVFGARTREIVVLLLWQFSIPVILANLIAWPVAYYYLHSWLEGYAYRIMLGPIYFIGAGLAALLIAWATVFAHAFHVARANPIHALRYE